jgi:hypothetical protein
MATATGTNSKAACTALNRRRIFGSGGKYLEMSAMPTRMRSLTTGARALRAIEPLSRHVAARQRSGACRTVSMVGAQSRASGSRA